MSGTSEEEPMRSVRRPGSGWPGVFTTLVLVLVAAGAVRLAFHNRHFVADHPMNVVWVFASGAAGLAVFAMNGAGVGLRQAGPWLGYGVVAAYLAFAVQGGLNGGLLRWLDGAPGIGGYALLGLGAAAAQTFGKWLVLRLVERLGGLGSAHRTIVVGLAVGVGFGLAEVLILGENQIVRHVGIPVFPWLGVWERAVAVGLHVFSGAVLAIGMYERRWMPLVVVVVLHAVDDTVAGAFSDGHLLVSVVGVELFFTAVTAVLWFYYRGLRDAALATRS